MDDQSGAAEDSILAITINLEQEIERLKRAMNAVILAHYYQDSEIQDLADFVGDGLQLPQRAAAASAEVTVFCGVFFMAETAKILNPQKLVLVPDLAAGCWLADGSASPSSAPAGGSRFLLTVNCDDFRHGSVVNWNGSFVVTTEPVGSDGGHSGTVTLLSPSESVPVWLAPVLWVTASLVTRTAV